MRSRLGFAWRWARAPLVCGVFTLAQVSVNVGCGDDGGGVDAGGSSGSGGTSPGGSAADLCMSNLDCKSGHRCLLPEVGGTSGSVVEAEPEATAPAVGSCSRECIAELCAPRACTSSTGSCGSPTCEDSSECGALEFCESDSGLCRPSAGECRVWQDCPVSEAVRRKAVIDCDGACRLVPNATSKISAPFAGLAGLSVTAPNAGDMVQNLATFKFKFTRSETHGFALLVPAPSDKQDEVRLEDATWGAVLAPNAGSCTWNDGTDIANGEWRSTRSDAPTEGTLYFIVQTVNRGKLVAYSDLTPFTIGPAAREVGDACSTDGIGGDCAHPDKLMGCYRDRCTLVCASNAACAPLKCGDPIAGVRYCQ